MSNPKEVVACPRCNGTGEYSITTEDGNGFSERCRPCGGTGRLSKEAWNAWCDYLASLSLRRAGPRARR
jgi:DnaJ-class molecular chaperone